MSHVYRDNHNIIEISSTTTCLYPSSKYHEMEAQYYSVQSKYMILLQEAQEPKMGMIPAYDMVTFLGYGLYPVYMYQLCVLVLAVFQGSTPLLFSHRISIFVGGFYSVQKKEAGGWSL